MMAFATQLMLVCHMVKPSMSTFLFCLSWKQASSHLHLPSDNDARLHSRHGMNARCTLAMPTVRTTLSFKQPCTQAITRSTWFYKQHKDSYKDQSKSWSSTTMRQWPTKSRVCPWTLHWQVFPLSPDKIVQPWLLSPRPLLY
jgi:hypothetical protein